MHTRNTRVCGATGADRISDLHESLISNILSRLPTMDAFRTCVLSKSWRYSWTSLQSLRLVEPATRVRDPNFPNRVATILSLPLINNVTSFTLQCSSRYPEQISSWISAALGGGANNLLHEFVIWYNDSGYHDPVYLPQELLDCASLRKLRLCRRYIIRAPAAGVINFPNLTSLYLDNVHIMNAEDSNTDTLVLNLPALTVLELIGCSWGLFKYVEIHAPDLSTFNYRGDVHRRSSCTSIRIIGARLALFHLLLDPLLDNIVLAGSTVDFACLLLKLTYDEDIPRFRGLVKEMSHVKHLILSNEAAEVIVRERLRPGYGAVERLEICTININIGSTLELLHAMPKLKYLTLDAAYQEEYDYDAVEHVVSSCMTSSLEEVVFRYKYPPSWGKRLFHMESYFLRKATKLKKVSLVINNTTHDSNEEREIVNQISTLMNASATPTIVKEECWSVYVFRRGC